MFTARVGSRYFQPRLIFMLEIVTIGTRQGLRLEEKYPPSVLHLKWGIYNRRGSKAPIDVSLNILMATAT